MGFRVEWPASSIVWGVRLTEAFVTSQIQQKDLVEGLTRLGKVSLGLRDPLVVLHPLNGFNPQHLNPKP